MKIYKLTEREEEFANIIWQNEPIASGDLVKLSEEEMNWKKSTTYTVLKKLSKKQAEELKKLIDEHREV